MTAPGAGARLVVDLDALAANIARVRSTVAPAEMMLVVKDDAYRHGLEAVVRRAAREGVTWFGAFDVETGRAVRALLGDDVRVFTWMSASASETAVAVREGLDLGVGDAGMLEEVAIVARNSGTRGRIHLKIDTGLHRNGVRPEQWPGVVARAAELEAEGVIEVVGVWSHIAEASDEEDDAARERFEEALSAASEVGVAPAIRHLAASAASFARPEFRYDMVRVGAFAYGIRSAGGPSEEALGLVPVARLEAPVIETGPVRVDVGVFEGLPSSLAAVARVGTAAGSRMLREIGEHLDVEEWPGAAIGDIVTVFGPGAQGEASATDLAERIDTIGEEILLRLSPLIERRYES